MKHSQIVFFFFSYLEPLAIALDKEKWSLVQLLMSSSYSGFGTSSLKQVKSVFFFWSIDLDFI